MFYKNNKNIINESIINDHAEERHLLNIKHAGVLNAYYKPSSSADK